MASATSPSSANAILPQWQLPWCVAMPSSSKRSGRDSKPMAHSPAGGGGLSCGFAPPEPTMQDPCSPPFFVFAAGLRRLRQRALATTTPAKAPPPRRPLRCPRRREVRRSFQALALDGWLALNPVTRPRSATTVSTTGSTNSDAPGRQRIVDFSKATLGEPDAIDGTRWSRENQVGRGDPAQPAAGELSGTSRPTRAGPGDPQGTANFAGGAIG